MTSIDKLRVKYQFQHKDFVTWCLTYYPEILFNVYTLSYDCMEWDNWQNEIYERDLKYTLEDKALFGINDDFSNIDTCITNRAIYDKEHGYVFYDEYAKYEINNCLQMLLKLKNKEEYKNNIALPIASTTIKQDRILKWRCPFDFVREYLYEQCGVNKKYEWFYKLFFKGKKYTK